ERYRVGRPRSRICSPPRQDESGLVQSELVWRGNKILEPATDRRLRFATRLVLGTGDAQWSIDWTRPGFVYVPIGMQVAKVMKLGGQPVRLLVNPEYNALSTSNSPHWSFRFGLTILAPAKPGR
ncbi:MAG: hypothetical protein WA354_09685, partial [Terracidiphilus sp.]